MNRTAVWVAAVCLMIVTNPVAAAPDAASAKAFVEKLYSHYPSKPGNRSAFDPTGKNANQVFDPGMIAAFREDTRLAHGEVGFVDSDPLCQCQDDSGLKATVGSVTMTDPNAADVAVELEYPSDKVTIALTLHLVPVNGAWRIHDLSTKDQESYRADLLKANKEAAAQHH
jgi:uncharacterized protein DUF3828